jgi:DNA invertase Pin-like site-specific DNA recombinase
MIGQLLLQAEFEKDLIGEKTSGAMRHHQRNGRRMSHHAPYGQTLDPADASMWIEDPDEQAAIRAIVQMRDGGTSYAKIAECLQHNDDVYPSRSGEWHSETVRRIYTRVQETN